MARDPKNKRTISITSDFALIVYPWASPYIDETMKEGEPFLLSRGPHYCAFTRNKNVGGTLQIDGFGSEMRGEVGDWVVLKTSSSKAISEDLDLALEEGQTKFIGQIYSKTVNHVADAEGNIRTNTQISVREWSHVFHIVVKFDLIAAVMNARGQNTQRSLISDTAATRGGQKDSAEAAKIFEDLRTARFNPFNLCSILLKVIGALSANDSKIDSFSNLYQVSTRLPVIPEKLVSQIIRTYVPESGAEPKFDKENPWSTGFLWPIVGVQKWNSGKKEYLDVFKSKDSLWENLDLDINRPYSANDPFVISNGLSFVESLNQQFVGSGVYEMYTDMLYFGDSKKCSPALFVRDAPMSFRKLYKDAPKQTSKGFEWTFFDDIPRTDISPASVVSITFSTTASTSSNYIRLNYDPQSFRQNAQQAVSTIEGVFVNIASQKKFGSFYQEQNIRAFLKDPTNPSRETTKPSDATASNEWFRALSTRIGNYSPYLFLFPSANLFLKDNDYPITVGMAVSIKFEKATVIGFVESINASYKVEQDGKRKNETYVELSHCCTEDEDGLLQPLPRELIASFAKYEPDPENEKAVLSSWKFKSSEVVK